MPRSVDAHSSGGVNLEGVIMITLEEIEEKLNKMEISFQRVPLSDSDSFKRKFLVKFLDFDYELIWWANIGYLKRDNMVVSFDDVVFNGNWPDGFKCHAIFLENKNVNCRVPVEEFN